MFTETKITMSGVKHDEGKEPWELLPFDAIRETVKVLAFGKKKYGARNWENGLDYSRVYGALMRHTTAWYMGEDLDEETGLSHLAHAGCCILFLLTFTIRGTGNDDRINTGKEYE